MPPPPVPPSAAAELTPILAPHPLIHGAYDTPAGKRQYLDTIFNETAQDYDCVEHWLSCGSGRWYRRKALQRAGLQAGMRMADVAVGTGLLAAEALTLLGPTGYLVGIDPCQEMMRRAKDRLGIDTVTGVADSLPFENSSFDFVSVGYALRHVEDLNKAFREFHRVLNPAGRFGGGRLCILEVSRPGTRLGRAFLRIYLGVLSRLIGIFRRLAPRTPELWAYYWETIDKCVPPARILQALRDTGFEDAKRTVVLGVFSEYTAMRR